MKFVLIGLGVLLSLAYLITSAIQATGVPYKHVGELAQISDSGESMDVKVTGKVKEGSLNYDPHTPIIEFSVTGPKGKSIDVMYRGIKPDAMIEGGHVILQGVYNPAKRKLKARTLLAKCPSRYKSEYEGASSSEPSPSDPS